MHGEPVEVLLDALNALDPIGAEDAEETAFPPLLSQDQRDALVRALMRSEAALLRKDADRFPALDRSVDERRSVALVLLAANVFTTARKLGLVGSATEAGAGATLEACPPAECTKTSSPASTRRTSSEAC